MIAQDVISAALAMVDTPFVHQGRAPGIGLDCAGLVVCVAAQLGIEHFDVAAYGRTPYRGLLEKTLDGQPALQRVDRDAVRRGDILLMRFNSDPQHLALFDGDLIIHAWAEPGKVCVHRLDSLWRSRIVRGYRFVGIAP